MNRRLLRAFNGATAPREETGNRLTLLAFAIAVVLVLLAAYSVMRWLGFDPAIELAIEGILALLGGALLLDARIWLTGKTLTQRAEGGRCVTCGYDLRATPERCPECGAVPAGKGEI